MAKNKPHSRVLQMFKRGEKLQGIIFLDNYNGAYPYYGEVHHGAKIYTSENFVDEDFVEQWIDQKFNEIIGGDRWYT